MRNHTYKIGAAILTSCLFVMSCMKNEEVELTRYITPLPDYTNTQVWQEAEKKTGDTNPEQIKNANYLSLSWNQEDGVILGPRLYYQYNSDNLGIEIDQKGYIHMENGMLSFLKVRDNVTVDTVIKVQYALNGGVLTIRDTSVTPAIEVTFNEFNFE